MKFFYGLIFVSTVLAENWATYPAVPKTATYNGFADPLYDDLPSCAKSCVTLSTGSTPCPYWDTGCLCVMPQWSGQVASCFVKSCDASDVASATALAYSLCTRVGANMWMMPASVSTAVSQAASGVNIKLSATAAALVTSSGDESMASATSEAEESESSGSESSGSASEGSESADATSATSATSSTSTSGSESSASSSGEAGSYAYNVSSVLAVLCIALSFMS